MNISIRFATPSDMPAVWALVHELAVYEKAPEQVITTPESMLADGFGEKPLFSCKVAETEAGDIIGIMLYYFAYSTWKGKILYLDDLVITEKYRNEGIGKRFVTELIEIAKANQAHQLRWHVLDWNTPAIQFYKKIGMELDAEWIACRMNLS
jgi:GNAT superfamily N-acetyltransferase